MSDVSVRDAARQALVKIDRAHTEIGEVAANVRDRWRMSIPANPDRDTDLIISAALNAAEQAIPALFAELDRVERWKAEALPVIDGLQDLGRVLRIPLGHSITGPEATERAQAVIAERDVALSTLQKVREKAEWMASLKPGDDDPTDACSPADAVSADGEHILRILDGDER